MTHLATLAEQRAEVEAALAALRRPLRQAQDRAQKRRRRHTEATPTWTGSTRDVMFILRALWLVDWICGDAVILLNHVTHPPSWHSLTDQARVTVVEDLFLSRDPEVVESWVDVSVEDNLPAITELWVTLAEWRAAQWVAHVNAERGLTPSSLLVHQQFVERLRAAPAPVWHRVPVAASKNARLLWAVRWRRKWGASVGTLQVGDVDTPPVLQTKASLTSCPF